jgi:[methyl-Co(III) methanol-specific corrinoid protein]:coenzyme M methyltransferase
MEITGEMARCPQNADAMALLGASLHALAGLEAARIPFCLTVQAEALGCAVEFGTMEQTLRSWSLRPSLSRVRQFQTDS